MNKTLLEDVLRYEADAMYHAVQGIEWGDTHHCYNWSDKPHRVVYSAVDLLRQSADEIAQLREELGAALTAVQAEPKKYVIGDLTMEKVFKPSGLENLSDLQTVLDAVEEALTASPFLATVLVANDKWRADNERLREALEFYADEIMAYSITQMNEPRSAVHGDRGAIARAALANKE